MSFLSLETEGFSLQLRVAAAKRKKVSYLCSKTLQLYASFASKVNLALVYNQFMYALESSLKGQPIISLQTGQLVAQVSQPILDIATLEIVAFTCQVPHRRDLLLIMASDIRQYASDCIIIDDEDQLTEPEDIVRLVSNTKDPYTPLRKTVVADTGRKLGTVEDYSINLDTNRVQKLYIKPDFWHSWVSSRLVVDRTQIIDITPEKITVRDATVKDTLLSPDPIPEINS
jgi:sporulation protein YlmC with PRC-barrel domain